MKKLVLVATFFISIFAFSQCTITGKSAIKVLEEETYSVDKEMAQCKDCHLWVSVGGNATISGDNRQNAVKIKANSGGRQVLSASILTPQGLLQCSKNIDILDTSEVGIAKNNVSTNDIPKLPNCDVQVNNFKEVKYAENIVSFFPNVTDGDYKYQWTVNYANGDQMISTEKVPQFPYTKENGISTVKVKVTSTKCIKEFTKTYELSFWKFL